MRKQVFSAFCGYPWHKIDARAHFRTASVESKQISSNSSRLNGASLYLSMSIDLLNEKQFFKTTNDNKQFVC